MTEKLLAAAAEAGASAAVVLPVSRMVLSEEFRRICRGNQCGNYGKCWVCPPFLPPAEEAMAQIRRHSHVLWYQSVSPLEDSFDLEGMFAAAENHAQISRRLKTLMQPLLSGSALHLTCGGCHLCPTCAKAENLPCRYPQDALPSLEGYCVDVYQTTRDTPLPYIHGPNTVTYFGAVLFCAEED